MNIMRKALTAKGELNFMLTKIQFNILYAYLKNEQITQRELSEICECSIGSVNSAVKGLLNEELLRHLGQSTYRLTDEGLKALEPYKVENAIIMAAGMSSRCAPLSYEKPKGLFVVKGEVLLERQIRQLQERGIRNIYVVVGYLKEMFYYLEEKMGVHIVTNNEYFLRNNLSSIYAVKEIFGNSYVCYSDNYIAVNGYESYVYQSYFAAQYSEEFTDEYVIETRKNGLITQYYPCGQNCWYQMGEMYFDRATASKFMELLEREYHIPTVYDMKVDDFYIRHLSSLDFYIKKNGPGDVIEFDTVSEIEKFDENFFQNMGTNIISNICEHLNCTDSDIKETKKITRGNTNIIFSFSCKGKKYIYRHPGVGSERIINRQNEWKAMQKAEALGLDPTLICCDPCAGWKLSRYIENVEFDYENLNDELRGVELIRRMHTSPVKHKLGWELNMVEGAKNMQALTGSDYLQHDENLDELSEMIEKLYYYTKLDGYEPEMCHNDCCDSNILLGKQGTYLIDWEYAADNDPAADISSFIIGCKHSKEDVDRILNLYFRRPISEEEQSHFYAYIAITAYYYFSWGIYQESVGNEVGELTYIWYNYIKEYSRLALKAYENAERERV